MITATPSRPPEGVGLRSPDPADQPIAVMFDAELAQRLHEAARPSPADSTPQERPTPRRETFQYD